MEVTREQFEEAVLNLKQAKIIIEAYIAQTELIVEKKAKVSTKKSYKYLQDVEPGEDVECVYVHSASKKHLTGGKEYPVLRVEDFRSGNGRFEILTDSGKKKWYYTSSTHFKVVIK